MGSGDKVRFWEDASTGSRPLQNTFPRLFSLSVNHGPKMVEVGMWEDAEWTWMLGWRRPRFQWEFELIDKLLRVISMFKLSRDVMDTLIWEGDVFGVFSVKATYECLTNSTRGTPNTVFKLLWQVKASPNMLVTTWRTLIDRLPTKTNLLRRGLMVNHLPCALCGGGNEIAQHLFLECIVAQRVWNRCFSWIGIAFVQHRELTYHFEQFYSTLFNHNQNMAWKGM